MKVLTNELWMETNDDDEIRILSELEMPSVASLASFDPQVKNTTGNTILHMIAYGSWMYQNTGYYLRLFDVIVDGYIDRCLHADSADTRDVDTRKLRYVVIEYLTTKVENKDRKSVLLFAISLGASNIADKILSLNGVHRFQDKSSTYYDITHVLPMEDINIWTGNRIGPKGGSNAVCRGIRPPVRLKYDILDIEVIRQIAKIYSSVVDWIYIPLTLFHLLHIILFSYSSVVLNDGVGGNETEAQLIPAKVIMYGFVTIEPLLFFVFLIYLNVVITLHLFRYNSQGFNVRFAVVVVKGARIFATLNFAYNVMVCVFVFRYAQTGPGQQIVLSISLLLGWLLVLDFARGLRPFHYFSDMVWNMLGSLISVLLVYVIFLLAFTFAFHVQLRTSPQLRAAFPDPFHTMFIVFEALLGEDKLFSDDLENEIRNGGGSVAYMKILFVVYAVVCSILLLNLVIAILNTVYKDRSTREKHECEMKSLELGMFLEICVPCIATRIMKRRMRKVNLGKRFGVNAEERWYIVVPTEERAEKPHNQIQAAEMNILERLEMLERSLLNSSRGPRPSDEVKSVTKKLKKRMSKLEQSLQEFKDRLQTKSTVSTEL